MSNDTLTLAPFYDSWQDYNAALMEAVRGLSEEQLAWRASSQQWAIWQIVGHLAGARAYWFQFLKESNEETAKIVEDGWEDHEDQPRNAGELVWALETTFKLIEDCLQRWTPDMLDDTFTRQRDGRTQTLTRQFVIWRVLQHDAMHCGEVSTIFGMHGLPEIDFWTAPHTYSQGAGYS